MDKRKLEAKSLRRTIDPKDLEGKNVEEDIIGQERVKRALGLLEIKGKGYHLFVAGPAGTGKTKRVLAELEKIASTKPTPPDLCYVENFSKPDEPRLIVFPAGTAKKFAEDLPHAVNIVQTRIALAEMEPEFTKARDLINIHVQAELEKKLQKSKIIKEGKAKNIRLIFTTPGKFIVSFETKDGTVEVKLEDFYDDHNKANAVKQDSEMTEEMKKQITEDLKNKYCGRFEEIAEFIWVVCIKFLVPATEEAQKLHQKALNEHYNHCVKSTLASFAKMYPSAREHLQDLGNEFLKNINIYNLYNLNPAFLRKANPETQAAILLKHEQLAKVNVAVDNSGTKGAPIVIETNPTYQNLFGYIEKIETKDGFIKPTSQNIKAGDIHKANGGYLIIDARNIFNQYLGFAIWCALKRTLKDGKITLRGPRESLDLSVPYLRPEAAPLDIKVILVGSKSLYSALNDHDDQFSSLFEKAEIESESDFTAELCDRLTSHLRKYSCDKIGKPITPAAVARILEYGFELVESQEKISMQIGKLERLAQEAALYSEEDKIYVEAVIKALEEKEFRNNLIEERYLEYIGKNFLKIDILGKKGGEINAMSVPRHDNHEFGHPSKVTCNVFAGKGGLIFIDRIIKQTGPIFNKAAEIMGSWLHKEFAKNKHLSFTAKICFEQNYYGLEGDSASIAEVAVLVSEISGIPIRQDLAVTGSMNQKGVIQPIGGVNCKIKGFYKACQKINFTGTQGLVIPRDNVNDLMLPKEIVQSAAEEKFAIYPVERIEEALEILLDADWLEIKKAMEKGLEPFYYEKKKTGF